MYNMNGLGGIMLSEINQTEKDKYCIESLVCGILKKKSKKVKLLVKVMEYRSSCQGLGEAGAWGRRRGQGR